MRNEYDIIVVGGGPAGYIAALRAAQLGASVALAERNDLGGTCLNRGCIPTKSYLETADAILESHEWATRGLILDAPPKLDMKKALACKNQAVRRLTGGVKSLLESRKIDIVHGKAELKGPGVVEVENVAILRSRSVILAGGSYSTRLPIPGAESKRVLLSEDILELDRVPSSLVVIGGGVIGVEMAQIFSAFGCAVTVIELESRLIPTMDEELSIAMALTLKRRGIEVHLGASILGIVDGISGLAVLLSTGKRLEAEFALLSVGRRPDLSCLGQSGIIVDGGRVAVDDYMATSMPGVYAPGDLNGRKMLAHAAFEMGEAAAYSALGLQRKAELRLVPSVVYGKPEMASVGLTEAEARSECDRVGVGVFPFAANGRAVASGDTEGSVKVIADTSFGEILGVHIVGHGASELINEAAILMRMEVTAFEITEVAHAHPSRSEAFMEATAAAIGRCVHLPAKG